MQRLSLWVYTWPPNRKTFSKEGKINLRTSKPTMLAILGGDQLIGESLELLLSKAGYRSRYLVEPLDEADGLNGVLMHVDLLILAPSLEGAYRTALLADSTNPEAMRKIPVIELIKATEEEDGGFLRYPVLWPCRLEALIHQIEEALLAGPVSGGS